MQWKFLYRAVDKEGQTIEFLLTARRDVSTAKWFFKKQASTSWWGRFRNRCKSGLELWMNLLLADHFAVPSLSVGKQQ
jgi:hypothetical protein